MELRSGAAWSNAAVPDEEYLKIAVTRLLPAYYSGAASGDAEIILPGMADQFVSRHNDTWLRDVLRTPHSRKAADAFAALGRAVEAEGTGNWAASLAEAHTAERQFRSAGSEAGVLRAAFERVQALQGVYKYEQCASAAQSLSKPLSALRYTWLNAQVSLETVACGRAGTDFEQTWAAHQAAIRTATDSHYSVLLLRALGLSAFWHADIGNASAAWREYMQGLKVYWEAQYPLMRAQFFYSEMSLLAPSENAAYAAVAWARENTAISASLAIPSYYASALHLLALDEMSAGLPAAAQAHLAQAGRAIAALPDNEERRRQSVYEAIDLAEREANLGRVKEPLLRMRDLAHQVENSEALLKLTFYSALGRLELQNGDAQEAEMPLQRALEIGNHAQANVSEEDRLAWARSMGETYRALVECEIRRGADPRNSWALWTRYRSALFEQNPANPPDEGTPSPAAALLSFAEMPSGVGAWLATSHGFRFRWLDPKPRVVLETAGRLLRGCSTGDSPESVLRADARQLSQWLLGDWEHELDGMRVVAIEGDGPVAALPWPTLVRASGDYWSQDFAIRVRAGNAPGRAGAGHVTAGEQALAVGEPALVGSGLPPLPEARREAERVFSLFPRSVLLEGQQATLSEVRKQMERATLFHFAGHGYGGEGGGLILRGAAGGPAMLRAADIRNLDLSRCRLAVLSGCASGAGELRGPGDPRSLVRAFLRAGAGEVVASSWNLNSASAQVFMQEFYSAMLTGAAADEALRSAAARVRARPEYRHPYYWAGLQLFSVQ